MIDRPRCLCGRFATEILDPAPAALSLLDAAARVATNRRHHRPPRWWSESTSAGYGDGRSFVGCGQSTELARSSAYAGHGRSRLINLDCQAVVRLTEAGGREDAGGSSTKARGQMHPHEQDEQVCRIARVVAEVRS